jgi:uncharacterized delta-60 repeat protein
VIIDSNNNILVGGQTDTPAGLIVKYDKNGALDTTFNTTINTAQPNVLEYYSVAFDKDNKIVAVGTTNDLDGLIVRYNQGGSLDGTFNGTGFIGPNQPTNSETYYNFTIDSNNKIIAVGANIQSNGLIARYNQNGTLDTTFNGTGFINGDQLINPDSYHSVVIDRNNKIVAVGQTNDNNGLIVRYHENGTLDTKNFNFPHGYINTEDGTDSLRYYSVAIQTDGKIVLVGHTDLDNLDSNGLIARYLSNGVLDAESNWNSQNFRESAQINNLSIGLLTSR